MEPNSPKPNPFKNKRPKPVKLILKIAAEITLNFIFSIVCFIYLINQSLPSIDMVETMKRSAYIKIYDSKNNVIAKYGDLQESIVLTQDLPKHLIHGIIDIEDRKFYKHHGIDFLAIIRSFGNNLLSHRIVGGGSTITQQLAKNILQNEDKVSIWDKTILRKIKELFLAIKLERKYSKEEILTFYLNRIYFGCACYGIYSASVIHFQKTPNQLNIYESAALVGLIQAPSRFVGNQEFWRKRTHRVLKAMLKNKHITQEEYDNFSKFNFKIKKNLLNYGYFGDWVLSNIPMHLKNRDLIVKTTIDPTIQENTVFALNKAFNEDGSEWNAQQGAMIVLDKNGAVKGMLGGLNYGQSNFNRAVNAQRSVGSFFKYYIFLQAIKMGLNPESMIDDSKISLGAWNPSNYLHQAKGKIKIKDAYAQSVNSSAVRLLLACGIKNTINLVQQLGINRKIKENPSIALGGFDASLLEIATTIIPIINSGYKTEPYGIEEIRDANTNQVIYRHQPKLEKVLDGRTIWYMWQLMQHVKYGTASSFQQITNQIIGGKTGTSNDYKDLTFIGASPEYIVATWFGRDDFKPMKLVAGKHLAVRATRYFFELMPANEKDIEAELGFQYNMLTFEDLLLKN